MEFYMIGISYDHAELSIREYATFTDTMCLSFYDELLAFGITQAVIISTCNRSEIYMLYDKASQLDKVKNLFVKYTRKEIESYLFEKKGKLALIYMYEVCGGYHSMVVGEDQIFHQMKNGYELSCSAGACAKEMHEIFQRCFACVRTIKARLDKKQLPISIAYLAMQKIKETINLEHKTLMIIGGGDMANLMLSYALEEPLRKCILCNRTMHHLKAENDVFIIPFHERYKYMKECDIVCSATSSPHVIIKKEDFVNVEHPLMMVDLALPRDIDKELKSIQGIQLFDMDDLKELAQAHKTKRKEALDELHYIIVKEVDEVSIWLHHHIFDDTIKTLQIRYEDMANQTYEVLKRKLSLSAHERHVVKKVLHTSFMRMLKEPMLQLKEMDPKEQESYQEMIHILFKGDDMS